MTGNAENHNAPNSSPSRRPSLLLVAIASAGVALLIGGGIAMRMLGGPDPAAAEAMLASGDAEGALRVSQQVLMKQPDSKAALMLAGKAAVALNRRETALDYFAAVEDDGSQESIEAAVQCGLMAFDLGRLTDAEKFYRRALGHDAAHLAANEKLLELLRLEARNWESLPLVEQLLRQRQYRFEYLRMAGPRESKWLDPDVDVTFLQHCARSLPGDPVYMLGALREQLNLDHQPRTAKEKLFRIVDTHPNLLEAQATLGQLLLDIGATSELLAWQRALPASADEHPLIWIVRGRWARHQGDIRSAARCVWEANRLHANDRAANLLMANLLASLGNDEVAALFQQRGDDLVAFDTLFVWGEEKEIEPAERLEQMIVTLEKLGRLWEARGWCEVLSEVEGESQFAKEAIARLDQQLAPNVPLTLATSCPANTIDLSDLPLPKLEPRSRQENVGSEAKSSVSFEDIARSVGLDFTYFVDRQRHRTHVYTFDFAGGGVGSLDFDQDGWPDLYLTQSCAWPPTAGRAKRSNELFWNHGGEVFEEMTASAGVGDTGFGNGVAVGDVNGDGFPDLYVCNLGTNRLYINNGDGTFSDHTDRSETAGDEYSLSAVFADLNRDGLSDLYVVNYLGGDAMTRQCESDGKLFQCSPLKFPGQQDRLYINLGDGQFREVTEEAGVLDAKLTGKGMDVIAADMDGNGGLDLFVANDTTACFLFINRTEAGSHTLRMTEQGQMSGVAYDSFGRLPSSMGIAVRDVNHDGAMDLFVTNFYRERNNFYVQSGDLLFHDEAMQAGLGDSSLHVMGWGPQFIDAELDGDADLVVANGSLDMQGPIGGVEALMRPQFFENNGDGRFSELRDPKLGAYFQSKYLGRAIARLDWNRDGLQDLAVTHMEAPVALLANRSARQGRYIAIDLRGVTSSRDAFGTIVRLTAGERQWSLQLVAGGGFEAASQRQMLIGLGDCEQIDELNIRWPSGDEQAFRDVAIDQEVTIVEGRDTLFMHSR